MLEFCERLCGTMCVPHFWDTVYTVSQKLCKIVFVTTSSNFHQL